MVSSVAHTPVKWAPRELKLKGFRVYAVDRPCTTEPRFTRRDCYKLILLTTQARLHYGHQSWELDGTYLLFFNPHIPYSMEMRGTCATATSACSRRSSSPRSTGRKACCSRPCSKSAVRRSTSFQRNKCLS
ncbi:hypothetical protein [Hymenobacter cellulosilyticus]|uniref:hypothetical protein n=1 Tax=Hymenobacter cellulosilyticus TaxID=2932248 RepID=UPI00287FFA56|nr:hypothetical protein [Hymenobacter cellulosilyticus]